MVVINNFYDVDVNDKKNIVRFDLMIDIYLIDYIHSCLNQNHLYIYIINMLFILWMGFRRCMCTTCPPSYPFAEQYVCL